MTRKIDETIPVGDDDDLCDRKRGMKRRLKGVFFLSGVFFFFLIGVAVFVSRDVVAEDVPVSPVPSAEAFAGRGIGLPYPGNEFRYVSSDGYKPEGDVSPDTFERRLSALLSGYPAETMVGIIARYDPEIAGLIVGIAKKESDWGRHSPSDPDGDCYNYWGYKGAGSRGMAMGYGCFGSPEEAVATVGSRIAELGAEQGAGDPGRMTIWKCGSSCAGHDPTAVRKWVSDVRIYYDRTLEAARTGA